jgi:lipopolysaccharide biosynthesis regulator YciM
LKASWQKQLLAYRGYLELGMLDAAANAVEDISPEDRTRRKVLRAEIDFYVAAKKWDIAAIIAAHLVKADPENPGAWLNLGQFGQARREYRASRGLPYQSA